MTEIILLWCKRTFYLNFFSYKYVAGSMIYGHERKTLIQQHLNIPTQVASFFVLFFF